jgi:hypothetical protein
VLGTASRDRPPYVSDERKHRSEAKTAALSRFVRTTWLLSAAKRLDLPEYLVSLRRVSEAESREMGDQARHRNVFARHSWENSFYIERIAKLARATVVEVFARGPLDEVLSHMRAAAELMERVAVVSAALGMKRKALHNHLAIRGHRRFGFDLAISPGFEFLRSSSREEPKPRGIPVDDTFIRRFGRCGFPKLLTAARESHHLGKRLSASTNWLFESLQEPDPHAAVVKTAIALESLLIVNESESLRGPLSERTAFLLADQAATRHRVARAIKLFYDVRSAIVHGGRRRQVSAPPDLLDGIDRFVVLLLLTLSANRSTWTSVEAAASWVDERKWGSTAEAIVRPFPGSHLTRALRLVEPT